MTFDMGNRSALAQEAYRRLQVQLSILRAGKGITEDTKRRLTERYLQEYTQSVKHLQESARDDLNAYRAEVDQTEKNAGAKRIEATRAALGDQLAAMAIRDRIAAMDGPTMIDHYRKSGSDFERAVIAAFGPGLLLAAGAPGLAVELERIASDESGERLRLAQMQDRILSAEREIDGLDPIGTRRSFSQRFGIADSSVEDLLLSDDEMSVDERRRATAQISNDVLTLDFEAA